jgi:Tol biopolymer transport system component
MTPIDAFERHLPSALTDLAAPATPDYLTDILGRTAATRQRPAWASLERWLPVQLATTRVATTRLPWRQLAVLALLALVLAATLFAYAGSQQQRLPRPFGPAANGEIVYSKGGDIYIRDAIDGASRPLIATEAQEVADSLSPLGTHVLIARFEADQLYLDVATIAGTDRVAVGGPFLNVNGIAWSPDESSLAVAHEINGTPSISIVRTDGSGSRTLDLGMPADTPAWRPPDGRQLSFRGEVDGNWALFLANGDGTGVVQVPVTRDLMDAPYEVLSPVWSPDGARIAFHRLVPTPGNGNGNGFRIHVAEVDVAGRVTTQQTFEFNATSDEEMTPQWLPDGDRLVFTRHDVDTDYLSIAEPRTGTTARDLALTSDGFIGNLRITPAPDGTYLIVHKIPDNSDWKVELGTGAVTRTDMDGDDVVWIQRRAP